MNGLSCIDETYDKRSDGSVPCRQEITALPDVTALFEPLAAGGLKLPNRIVMAPLTRLRTLPDLSVAPMAATYYSQRASAGLIISEAIAAAPFGAGYGPMPALVTGAQVDSWKPVVEAVHNAGGRVAAQLWHCARARPREDFLGDTMPFPATRAPLMPTDLTDDELAAIPRDFASAARKAIDAGFDAIEVHAGNGMILANFLRGDVNRRSDAFGGSADRRARLLLDVLDAVIGAVGADRTGVKIAPNSLFNARFDSLARDTFAVLLPRLATLGLAFVQVNRATSESLAAGAGDSIPLEWVREHYPATLIGTAEFTREEGAKAVAAGTVDAVAYGRKFLANPDLPERLARDASFNDLQMASLYDGGATGYLDYPSLECREN